MKELIAQSIDDSGICHIVSIVRNHPDYCKLVVTYDDGRQVINKDSNLVMVAFDLDDMGLDFTIEDTLDATTICIK